jgi:predicted phosphodiesterase
MRIGILADIHDAIEPLSRAITLLREHGAEKLVTLGDVFDSLRPGQAAPDVARMLLDAGAIGVWGNHDIGLSDQIPDVVRNAADSTVLSYTETLKPQLVIDDHRFSHVLPWRDPHRIEDLWMFDDFDDRPCVERCFDALPERILFVGHYHRWWLSRRDGVIAWQGVDPIYLHRPDRYLVVVAAVRDNWCALYDTDEAQLTPIRCDK